VSAEEHRIAFSPSCVGVTLVIKQDAIVVEVFVTTRQLNAMLAAVHVMEQEE
jgi:hypothetical protein